MKSVIKAWRDAATLIVLARQKPVLPRRSADTSCNYDILLQTRTDTATSFASAVVFPGGVYESADENEKWVDLIKSYGYKEQHFNTFHREGSILVPLFQNNTIQRHISLRITAIRETFEETGLLLCSRKSCEERTASWADCIEDFDVQFWREKVSKDPNELFNLCEKQNCYPDIWALHYWSNWLTPPSFKKRFDTAFFVVALEDKPTSISCNGEAAVLDWHSIDSVLERNHKREVNFFPPQFYEINRLKLFKNLDDLVEFASKRSGYGTELYYPYIIPTRDGGAYLLPGDDHYPKDINLFEKPAKIDKNTLELREGAHILHRCEIFGDYKKYIFKNYTPEHHIVLQNQLLEVPYIEIYY